MGVNVESVLSVTDCGPRWPGQGSILRRPEWAGSDLWWIRRM